ncbi:MAG: sigma-70 family RNA polymerase sigma factor [Lachnospiraceae bacterium]|nr:sigma-70 family RNA polymerase sigma factor [Lachnospiraceae bacterium]
MQENTKEDKIKQYYPMIYKYVYVRLGNDAQVQDIVQETLYKYLQANISFPNESKEKSWLFTVASNLCKNYWRSNWYKHVFPVSDNDIPGTQSGGAA